MINNKNKNNDKEEMDYDDDDKNKNNDKEEMHYDDDEDSDIEKIC